MSANRSSGADLDREFFSTRCSKIPGSKDCAAGPIPPDPCFFAGCPGVSLALLMMGDTMKVHEVMTTPPQTCRLDTSLAIVSRRMKEKGCGTLIVLDQHGKPAGMLTDRDLALAIGESNRNASHIAAHEAMTGYVYTCSPDESLHTALERMSEARVRRLPVVTVRRGVARPPIARRCCPVGCEVRWRHAERIGTRARGHLCRAGAVPRNTLRRRRDGRCVRQERRGHVPHPRTLRNH